jgi:hypothetical protein
MKLPFKRSFFSLFLLVQPAVSQQKKSRKLAVYCDCSGFMCDEDYIRTEINGVDLLRDAIVLN